jgi:CubicO group peptidase (beta-lactamase class C family)
MRVAILAVPLLFATHLAASAAAQTTFSDGECAAIQPFIEQCVASTNAALVVGLVDESGSQVFAAGTLNNGTNRKVDGDTMFYIGSVSKTFTSLLALEMATRGDVQLDDPVAKYLPASVDVPTYNGKKITLRHLAEQSSGLPMNPSNMSGVDERAEYESYSVEQIYAYLAGFQLRAEPGSKYIYSNVGMALLGHALERRAGASFESLIVERICKPLGMDSTTITVTPELESRVALGHEDSGEKSKSWRFRAYHPAGDIHSSANDLLKYAAAQAGLTKSPLAPVIEESHTFRHVDGDGIAGGGAYSMMGRTAMPWVDRNALQPAGMDLRAHAGGAGSYHVWVGFDKKQRRGVTVLSTVNHVLSVEAIGWTILQRLPLTEQRKLEFSREMIGVGVALSLHEEPRGLRITRVLPGSPAATAGLADGQIIMKIDDVATAGKTVAQCVELLRGPAGTKVRLELADAGQMATRTVDLTRQRFAT